MGMIFSCFPLYVGEISAPSIRGALVGLVINGMPLGTLIGNIMGPNMSMMWFGIISLALNLCYMTVFPFLPQSPHHFVRHEDLDAADKAIQWYYRKSDVRTELENVKDFVGVSRAMTFRERLEKLKEPKNRRAFTIVVLLFFFMQLSGLNSIVFYMEIIVRSARVTCMAPFMVVIVVSTIGIILGWVAMYAIDRCGRRILLAISSSGVILGMVILGLHFALLQQNYDPESLQWLPILALITFMLMCIGLVPVPSTMLSELFPADLKSAAGFIGSVTSAIFAFVASKTYQPLVDLMAEQYVFWIYGFIMTICLVYSLFFVPETKGKSLQEIQEMLARESAVEYQEDEDEVVL
ncbi:hypothetical protein KM043_015812 [Ampulex compressa]|nr:hypothetical protein KM043_015812 [Ampulex compressa]